MSDRVAQVTLVRLQPINLPHPKLVQLPYNIPPESMRSWRWWYRFPMHVLQYVRSGWRALRRAEHDLVISINPFPYASIAWLLSRIHGLPTVIMFIGDDLKRFRVPVLSGYLRILISRCLAATVPGESDRRLVIRHGVPAQRIFVLPHTIDVDRFRSSPARKTRYDVLFVGDLIPRKRPDLLVRAMRLVIERRPDASLAIVGQGPLFRPIETWVHDRKLERQIRILGPVYGEELIQLFHQARVFALPSRWEGVPFALIEAMCADLVPVVTDVGAIREVVHHGVNGIVLDPALTERTLADALLDLLENPDDFRRLQAGVRDCIAQFEHHRATAVWNRILERYPSTADKAARRRTQRRSRCV